MVRSLEALGLVRRIRMGRARLVDLTRAGHSRRRGRIEVLMKWEADFMKWQGSFGKETWLLYPYDHPDD